MSYRPTDAYNAYNCNYNNAHLSMHAAPVSHFTVLTTDTSGNNNGNPTMFSTTAIPFDNHLSPGELLVQVICHAMDAHSLWDARHGECIGHEAVGWVVGVPESTQNAYSCDGIPVGIGDRIVWRRDVLCGRCKGCKSGTTCRHPWFRYGSGSDDESGSRVGSCAGDFCVLVAGTVLYNVPDGLSDVAACLSLRCVRVKCGGEALSL